MRRSEPLEHVLEGAVGEQLLRELATAGPHLAPHDAISGEPVLADPIEPWRVDVHRHGRLALVVTHAMDVAGAAPTRVTCP